MVVVTCKEVCLFDSDARRGGLVDGVLMRASPLPIRKVLAEFSLLI
jgi:hypothetical protein